ncbi:MAG: response regulator [Candidatus Omnitrophica bacterium]|nr:response regulator [Candidatus Omnitrophota bacterium]
MSKKILVVEDEDSIRNVLEVRLKNCGFEVVTAADGEDGLNKARAEKPDLMILDLGLPKLPGEEVCRQLRNEENNVPIIMLTAKTEDVDRVVGKVLGANYYMTKPFEWTELLKKIYKYLDMEEQAESGPAPSPEA